MVICAAPSPTRKEKDLNLAFETSVGASIFPTAHAKETRPRAGGWGNADKAEGGEQGL